MKRTAILALIFVMVIFGGCENINNDKTDSSYYVKSPVAYSKNEKIKGVWISFIELAEFSESENIFNKKIDEVCKNAKSIGLNTLIVQVRANCDAAYFSDYFPLMPSFKGFKEDPLKTICNKAHENGLKIHAWVNPYRVSASSTVPDNYESGYPVFEWWKKKTDEVLFTDSGTYLNPSKKSVSDLIINGISEIVSNYEVDGIHFDDYFYPTDDEKFDEKYYNEYKASATNPLSLADWRRTNISLLIERVYKTVHKKDKLIFGVSPAAYISNDFKDENYGKYFADIYLWISQNNFVDYIAPQLYFGYNYIDENMKFDILLKKWSCAKRSKNVKLVIGLAAYKIGTVDAGTTEWTKDTTILKKQIEDINKKNLDGYIFYSYTYLFSNDKLNKLNLNSIKEMEK